PRGASHASTRAVRCGVGTARLLRRANKRQLTISRMSISADMAAQAVSIHRDAAGALTTKGNDHPLLGGLASDGGTGSTDTALRNCDAVSAPVAVFRDSPADPPASPVPSGTGTR